jgi:hypothetical protein
VVVVVWLAGLVVALSVLLLLLLAEEQFVSLKAPFVVGSRRGRVSGFLVDIGSRLAKAKMPIE